MTFLLVSCCVRNGVTERYVTNRLRLFFLYPIPMTSNASGHAWKELKKKFHRKKSDYLRSNFGLIFAMNQPVNSYSWFWSLFSECVSVSDGRAQAHADFTILRRAAHLYPWTAWKNVSNNLRNEHRFRDCDKPSTISNNTAEMLWQEIIMKIMKQRTCVSSVIVFVLSHYFLLVQARTRAIATLKTAKKKNNKKRNNKLRPYAPHYG